MRRDLRQISAPMPLVIEYRPTPGPEHKQHQRRFMLRRAEISDEQDAEREGRLVCAQGGVAPEGSAIPPAAPW